MNKLGDSPGESVLAITFGAVIRLFHRTRQLEALDQEVLGLIGTGRDAAA